jgi:hypothetical protein
MHTRVRLFAHRHAVAAESFALNKTALWRLFQRAVHFPCPASTLDNPAPASQNPVRK